MTANRVFRISVLFTLTLLLVPQLHAQEPPPAVAAVAPAEPNAPPSFEEAQRVWFEKLSSASRLVENLSAEVASTKSQADALKDQLAKALAENVALKERLARIDKGNIAVIAYQDRWRTDTSLSFWFRTDKLGRISAKLRRGNSLVAEKKSDLGFDHYFTFPGLTPEQEHVLEVVALDAAGEYTNVKIGPDQYSDLRVSTLGKLSPPGVALNPPGPNDITPRSIRLPYNLSDRAIVVIDCLRVLPGTISTVPCTKPRVGSYEVDKLGRIKGEFKERGSGAIVYEGLEPDTQYIFKVSAYNEYGLVSPDLSSLTPYSTAKIPSALDFSGPVSLEMRPDKVIASWRTTASPTSSEFRLTLATGETITKPALYSAKDNKVTVDLPVGPLVNALREVKPETATSTPTLQAVMYSEDGRRVAREFQVTVGVPKELAKKSNLTKDQKDAFQSLADGFKNKGDKKLSWQNIVELGLPVVLSFF